MSCWRRSRPLWVSLDGASPECYGETREAQAFPKILSNLRLLRSIMVREDARKPELGIAFVGTKRNAHELADVISLGQRLGATRFSISNVQPHTPELGARSSTGAQPASLRTPSRISTWPGWTAAANGTTTSRGSSPTAASTTPTDGSRPGRGCVPVHRARQHEHQVGRARESLPAAAPLARGLARFRAGGRSVSIPSDRSPTGASRRSGTMRTTSRSAGESRSSISRRACGATAATGSTTTRKTVSAARLQRAGDACGRRDSSCARNTRSDAACRSRRRSPEVLLEEPDHPPVELLGIHFARLRVADSRKAPCLLRLGRCLPEIVEVEQYRSSSPWMNRIGRGAICPTHRTASYSEQVRPKAQGGDGDDQPGEEAGNPAREMPLGAAARDRGRHPAGPPSLTTAHTSGHSGAATIDAIPPYEKPRSPTRDAPRLRT